MRVSAVLSCLLLAASSSPLAAQAKTATDAPAKPQESTRHEGGKHHGGEHSEGAGEKSEKSDKPEKDEKNAYDYYLPGADGKSIALSDFKGKYIVLVNLGRKSSYTEQLPALIKLNDNYKAKDVVVIGVPSNDFGASEPGTPAEIQKAYADAKVDFLVTAPSKIIGDDELPIYKYVTTGKSAPAGGPVAWNYTKFIIDKKGNIVARLDPDVAPDSPEFLATLDQILEGSYKPKRAGGGGGKGGGSAPE
ncbi:redoxin domain-containing protein [Granulicella sp. 5B5]|nr:redoxin domain-containing protein [Granulicella sp. 5B5]